MDIGDLIISIISLLILLIFVFKPLFKKFLMNIEKKKCSLPPREDPVYQSVESYSQRILNKNKELRQYRIIQPKIVIPVAEKLRTEKQRTENKFVLGKIEKQSALKKAVIWKEILSAPIALKDSDNLF